MNFKSVLFIGFAFSAAPLFANENDEGKFFVGVDYLSSSNTFTETVEGFGVVADVVREREINSEALQLNVGYRFQSGFSGLISLQQDEFDLGVYPNTNNPLYSLGFAVRKDFTLPYNFAPYVQVGLASGVMQTEGYSLDSSYSLGLNGAVGLAYNITSMFQIQAGASMQSRIWTPVYKDNLRFVFGWYD